jgi:DNA modification methylase
MAQNTLWHGDNLLVLRELPAESVDLVYLDPPFKSNTDYNMLYKERDGSQSVAQRQVFSDTWKWDDKAAKTYRQLIEQGGSVSEMIEAFKRVLSTGATRVHARSEMLAYLAMMTPRLIELHRVLKPTGSLYLHCDSTASHYLKLLLDAIFGPDSYINEIIWKRQTSHNDAAQGAKHYGRIHDVLLFYSKSGKHQWSQPYRPYDPEYVEKFYRHVEEHTGRRYRLSDITAPGGASPKKRNPFYELLGVKRYYRFKPSVAHELIAQGRIVQTKPGTVPAQKRYFDEMKGMPVGSLWDDIKPVQAQATERIGFPTQKPEALLERIIEASTAKRDVVLDPFCGCGTTIAVAERSDRRWIGIDITHLAIEVIQDRLAKVGLKEGKDYRVDRRHAPRSLPDIETLAAKNKHEFQGWAVKELGIEPFQLKPGPDRGIDARKVFFDPPGSDNRREIIVSVKGGKLSAGCVRDLLGVVRRERAQIGVLVTLKPPSKAMLRDATDAGHYRGADGLLYSVIQILTVADLVDGKAIQYPLQAVPIVHQVPVMPTVAKRATVRATLPAKRGTVSKPVQQALPTDTEYLQLVPPPRMMKARSRMTLHARGKRVAGGTKKR